MYKDLRKHYLRAAVKCLVDYEDPAVGDIRLEMCFKGQCPLPNCTFPKGKKYGEECGHVIAVKILSSKIKHVAMGD